MTRQHLGAFATDRDTCQGDSGGPLFIEAPLSLVGITSFGIGCADETAGVYTNVGYFSGYIRSIAGDVVPTLILGDVKLDGNTDFLDIAPLVVILASGEYQDEADISKEAAAALSFCAAKFLCRSWREMLILALVVHGDKTVDGHRPAACATCDVILRLPSSVIT